MWSAGAGGTSIPFGQAGTGGAGGAAMGGSSSGGEAGSPGAAGGAPTPDIPGAEWQQIPGSSFTAPDCYVYQAKPGTLTFPPLTWSSCGTGCGTADPLQGHSSLPPAWFASSSTYHGTAYTQFFLVFKGAWNRTVYRIVRLSDGATVMALLKREHAVNGNMAPCDFSYPRVSALIQRFWGGTKEWSVRGLAPEAPDKAWIWPMPARLALPPGGLARTDSALIVSGKGVVFGMLHPETNSDWTTLESPSDSMYPGSEGDLAIWAEWSTPRIRGWAPDGNGVRTLIQSAPAGTCFVQPSPDHVVGVALDNDCAHGYQRGVRFWYSPRVYSQTQNVALDPVVEHDVQVDPYVPRTWGDYAALLAFDQPPKTAVSEAGHLDVVRLSTGKAWRIDPEPGYSVQQASFTFDDTWLYYGETIANGAGVQRIYKLRRLRLDQLDAWGKPL